MNVTLIIIGILALTITAIAAYVFMFAARNYVTGEDEGSPTTDRAPESGHLESSAGEGRNRRERRNGTSAKFPLTVNGILIPGDRRRRPQ